MKVLFAVLMVVLIAVPIFIPANTSNGYKLSHSGWIASANVPVSLANGGTAFKASSSPDWLQASQLDENTRI